MRGRRSFLAGMVAAGLAPQTTWAEAGSPAFVSAARLPDGGYALCGLSHAGKITFTIPLPARGHAAAVHPDRPHAVAFARRPGRFALVIDCVTGEVLHRLDAPEGRHFFGHGAFSDDGGLLFTTENDYEAGQGIVGVWDTRRGFRRVREFLSGGIGPHEMRLLPDGNLVVANGGIETHPDTGRMKLNIQTMRPNLSYLTTEGAVIAQVELPPELHKNSIRHIAVDYLGRVAMGMQWQGDIYDDVPLVAVHDRDSGRLVLGSSDDHRPLSGYVGSVAMTGREVAITSPRGGLLQVMDARDLSQTTSLSRPDVCGVAVSGAGFVVTTGAGNFEALGTDQTSRAPGLAWDNHLIPVA